MIAHTPGPWFVDRNHVGKIMGVASPKRRHDLEFVAECQDEANASLIAAAPDLLEALKEIKRGRVLGDRSDLSAMQRMMDIALAAIAKAEGKT